MWHSPQDAPPQDVFFLFNSNSNYNFKFYFFVSIFRMSKIIEAIASITSQNVVDGWWITADDAIYTAFTVGYIKLMFIIIYKFQFDFSFLVTFNFMSFRLGKYEEAAINFSFFGSC